MPIRGSADWHTSGRSWCPPSGSMLIQNTCASSYLAGTRSSELPSRRFAGPTLGDWGSGVQISPLRPIESNTYCSHVSVAEVNHVSVVSQSDIQ